jgi:hypothetical protein
MLETMYQKKGLVTHTHTHTHVYMYIYIHIYYNPIFLEGRQKSQNFKCLIKLQFDNVLLKVSFLVGGNRLEYLY